MKVPASISVTEPLGVSVADVNIGSANPLVVIAGPCSVESLDQFRETAHGVKADDLIKLGGIWVSPLEIEEVLREHKDVADAAVVARDEGMGVPILKAFIVTDRSDSRLTKELSRLCRVRLATFKVPQAFEVVSELPRTTTGKLQRYVLRQSSPDDVKDARK